MLATGFGAVVAAAHRVTGLAGEAAGGISEYTSKQEVDSHARTSKHV